MNHYSEQRENDSESLIDNCPICGIHSDLSDGICSDCITEKEQSEALRREYNQVDETVSNIAEM